MMEEPDDGLNMARELRKKGHTLPIIMLTSVNAAMGLNIDKDEEMVPVDEFQTKPVEPATLVAKVKGAAREGGAELMVASQQEQLRAEIAELVEKLGPGRSTLIPILQDVKRRHRAVDGEAMQVVADMLDIHPVEVYSVASFYAFLHGAPEGAHVIRLCGTLSCDFAGKDAVADALRAELGIDFDQTTPDGLVHARVGELHRHVRPGPRPARRRRGPHAGHPGRRSRDRRRLPAVRGEGRGVSTVIETGATPSPTRPSSPTRTDGGARHVASGHHRHGLRLAASRAAAAPASRPG